MQFSGLFLKFHDFHWFPHIGTSQVKQSPTSSPWRVGVPPKRPNAPKLCGWSSWRSQSRNERRGQGQVDGLTAGCWIRVGYHKNDGLRIAWSYCRILSFFCGSRSSEWISLATSEIFRDCMKLSWTCLTKFEENISSVKKTETFDEFLVTSCIFSWYSLLLFPLVAPEWCSWIEPVFRVGRDVW